MAVHVSTLLLTLSNYSLPFPFAILLTIAWLLTSSTPCVIDPEGIAVPVHVPPHS